MAGHGGGAARVYRWKERKKIKGRSSSHIHEFI